MVKSIITVFILANAVQPQPSHHHATLRLLAGASQWGVALLHGSSPHGATIGITLCCLEVTIGIGTAVDTDNAAFVGVEWLFMIVFTVEIACKLFAWGHIFWCATVWGHIFWCLLLCVLRRSPSTRATRHAMPCHATMPPRPCMHPPCACEATWHPGHPDHACMPPVHATRPGTLATPITHAFPLCVCACPHSTVYVYAIV